MPTACCPYCQLETESEELLKHYLTAHLDKVNDILGLLKAEFPEVAKAMDTVATILSLASAVSSFMPRQRTLAAVPITYVAEFTGSWVQNEQGLNAIGMHHEIYGDKAWHLDDLLAVAKGYLGDQWHVRIRSGEIWIQRESK